MSTFNVKVAVAKCPISDDDLNQLAGHPEGWTVRTHASGYGSGFQLRLSGDATDESDAERRVRTAVDAWLVANDLTGTVAAVEASRDRRR